jgi:hypothetical protein
MSDWQISYRDVNNGRDAQSTHPSKEAAIAQAVHLELRERCQVQKIEGPSETINRDEFIRLHLSEYLRKSGNS